MGRVTNARTKKKKVALRLKSLQKRMLKRQHDKMMRATAPKGQTITGRAKDYAAPLQYMRSYIDGLKKRPTGQRKRRKIARQTNRYIKY